VPVRFVHYGSAAAGDHIAPITVDDELSRADGEHIEVVVLYYLPVVQAEGAKRPAVLESLAHDLAGLLVCHSHGSPGFTVEDS
jgi:hypothetical protein